MYVENEKINELKKELQELLENYQCNKSIQGKLTAMSVRLSDEVAKANSAPSISDKENRQWVKLQKIGQKEIFGIEFTLQQLQTIHQNILDPEELLQVVSEINSLYERLQHMKDNKKSKQYRELYKQYLDLKSKLEEIKVKPKTIQQPVEIPVDFEYNVATIKYLVKNINVLYQDKYINIRLDIESALSVVKFTQRQAIALNQAITTGIVDSTAQKDYELACKKISHALNTENIYKKCK